MGLSHERYLESINKIETYLENLTLSQFRNNELLIDAVVRNFMVIGEAGNNIPSSIRHLHPNIPWKQLIGMRNIIVHEYFGVDVPTLWHTANHDLPILKELLQEALSDPNN